MTWVKLRGKFGSPSSDKALITLGKIVVALSAISSILGGLIDIGQGLTAIYNAGISGASVVLLLFIVLLAGLRIALGYGYYLLLDPSNTGLLVSVARFFVQLGAGISLVFSPFMIMGGIIYLFFDPIFGVFLIAFGLIAFCLGLGTMFFIDERDELQITRKTSESRISQPAS